MIRIAHVVRASVLCSCLVTSRARAQEPLITHRDLVTHAWVDYPVADLLRRISDVPRR